MVQICTKLLFFWLKKWIIADNQKYRQKLELTKFFPQGKTAKALGETTTKQSPFILKIMFF
jgi:hypothetical protein